MTGIPELRMVCAMVRMERSRPPGVFSWTTRACDPSAWARSTAVVSNRSVIGVMAPSSSMMDTGCAAWPGAAPARDANRSPATATAVLRMSPSLAMENSGDPGSERAAKVANRLGEALDLRGRIVDRKARPERARDAEALHERLGAVVARAHGDAPLVQQRGAVVRVEPLHVERHDRALDLRVARPVDRRASDARERVETA